MQKSFGSLFIIFVFSAQSFAQPVSRQLDSVLTILHQQHLFNGTVLYAENGKVRYKKAFGTADYRTGTPLTTSSAFNLASITKQFVAMGILLLQEKGLLSVDDKVKRYLPQLPYKNVTIRQLLTHTSGIPEYFDLVVNRRQPSDTLTNESLLALLVDAHLPADFDPGTKWQYCNTNYVLLASLIQRVAKESLADFIRTKITVPLRMNDTYVQTVFMPPAANRVIGFAEENGRRQLNDLSFFDGVTGDGNLYSSVEDLYRWERALTSAKLVTPATLRQAFAPVQLVDGTTAPYGFGWGIEKEGELYRHTGSWAGFRNVIYRDVKNDRTLVLFSSATDATGVRLAGNIFENKKYVLPTFQLIKNIRLVDGTNSPVRDVAVRMQDGLIKAVGALAPYPGETVIDGEGQVLAPGFIDTHSHLVGDLWQHPDAIPAVSQGITTIVGGQDGSSEKISEIQRRLKVTAVAVNLATYTGHTALRLEAMGAENLHRTATSTELDAMKTALEQEMRNGSLGLSTGLEYEGAHFSSRDEVLQLAKIAARHGGRYISHLRSEDVDFKDAIDEIISIGKEAGLPVQISHVKIALKDDWGSAALLLARLQSARMDGVDLTADCYPYAFWYSTLRVLFPKTDYTILQSATFAVEHTVDPDSSVVFPFLPDKAYEGKTITAIARIRHVTPAQALLELIAMSDEYAKRNPGEKNVEGIIGKSMTDADVETLLMWPHTNVCSDGGAGGHPRSYGTFTRVLGRYVREKKWLSLPYAIYKMTALAAAHVGLTNRGVVAPGFAADLVLFDPQSVEDRATIENPKSLSAGIKKVWVNGKLVYAGNKPTGELPGILLTRADIKKP